MFDKALPKFLYPPEVVAKAVSQERLGGICHFNICGGGETLLPPQMTEYIRAILEQGHYVMVITNGTVTKRFNEIVHLPPDLLERLCFKFSFHYRELKERNLLECFFSNIKKVREAGCSFSLEFTPSDEDITLIEEIKQMSLEQVGAVCHVTVARDESSPSHDMPILTKMSREQYEMSWKGFDSDMFRYKLSVFGQKRKEFCYAGAWSGFLDLTTGIFRQCTSSFSQPQNIFENPSVPIKKTPIGKKCSEPHCFNAHAFLTLGLIPELDSENYAKMRNRTQVDGTEWLTPKMKSFLSNKLKHANDEYTKCQQLFHEMRYSRVMRLIEKILLRIRLKLSAL